MTTIFDVKYLKKCSLGLVIAVFLLFFGFVDFLGDMKSENMWSDAHRGTNSGEIIVVLTGGNGRVASGLELLKASADSVMIISGVNENAGMSSIFANYDLGHLKGRIFLEKQSKSTYGNAEEVSDMIETLSVLGGIEVDSITLVTSPYHMYRASYTFRNVFPDHIKINNHPTVRRDVFLEDWHRRGGFVSALKEYLKSYIYYVRLSFR